MNRHGVSLSTLIILMVLTIPGAALAQQSYSEDFTTTTYKDEINTTADWDIAAGELKLPSLPTLAGWADTPGFAYRVAVAGNHAFVADYGSGLQVIDITNPLNPVLVGSYDTPGIARDVAVAGDYAFVADDGPGFLVINISDPTSPTLVSGYVLPCPAWGVAVAGNLAIFATGTCGLQLIDITDPTTPIWITFGNTPGSANGVAVSGNRAFVADGDFGLQVIDISDPSSPVLAGGYDTAGYAIGIAVAGDLAFVADSFSGLQVIDILDPSSPVLVGSYDTPGQAVGIAVSGDQAFVADFGSGLQVIDISEPASPVLAGTHNMGEARDVAVAGDLAFVPGGASGLQLVQVRYFEDPVLVGSYNTPGIAREIAVAGNLAFIADGTNMRVIDISDPANPTFAGSALTQSSTRDVAVAGDYAFTAEGSAGLQVLDISDPTNPTFASDFNLPGYSYGIAVAGDYAFLADDTNGLDVIDISDPTLTQYAGNYNTPGNAYAVAIAGDHAFVADFGHGLQVIDISDPSNPALAGSYNTPGRALGVAIAGDFAFVADYYNGLQVIDISDPSNPVFAGNYDTPNVAEDVTIVGDHAFVTDWTTGLLVLDITDPANPVLAGDYNTPTTAWAVAVAGNHAFVTDELNGLQIIQVFDHLGLVESAIGQSLAVDGAADAIPRAQLVSTETAIVTWELSADAGANWTPFTPDGAWARITLPGDDLIWRSTHTLAGEWNPTVSDLTIDWLNEFAPITSTADVPDDQGGWVYLNFTRSGYDFTDETSLPVTGYGTYRRVDDMQKQNRILGAPSHPTVKEAALSSFATHRVRQVEDRFFVLGGKANSSKDLGEFPPGVWEFISFHSAQQQDSYLSLVPTVADSTVEGGIHWSVFLTTTHTTNPSIWFASHPDSGYSVDNIAPGVPSGFRADYDFANGASLAWDESPAEDFQYFRVYRGDSEDFEIEPETLIHETTETSWIDATTEVGHFYKLTALDHAGNESDPASPEEVTGIAAAAPRVFALHQNSPNPFNPSTTIRFELPSAGDVRLEIYDVAGRRVATLLDGVLNVGRHAAIWHGKDENGLAVGSGLYFYRLSASGKTEIRKMLLLK